MKIITFLQRHDWLGHVVEAIFMAVVVAVLAALVVQAFVVAVVGGLFFAAGHFHGREKRDYEVKNAIPPPHLSGYLIWRWSWDQLTDFVPVALLMVMAAWLLTHMPW